jgi:formate dehydrogenase subunit delta
MNIERLTRMANDISHYFAAEPDHAAGVASIADHIKRFWDPVMRKQIIEHLHAGGDGLEPMAKEAVELLERLQSAAA